MNVERRHFYRFSYLKSDHWSDLRLRKLVADDAVCCICKVRNLSNDVHHINYRNLYDVKLSDLRTLCRDCHSSVHTVLKENERVNDTKVAKARWGRTLKVIRAQMAEKHNKFETDHGISKMQHYKHIRIKFRKARRRLIRKGIVCKNQLQVTNPRRLINWYMKRWEPIKDVDWMKHTTVFEWPCGEH